jgi:hypothetical protein
MLFSFGKIDKRSKICDHNLSVLSPGSKIKPTEEIPIYAPAAAYEADPSLTGHKNQRRTSDERSHAL